MKRDGRQSWNRQDLRVGEAWSGNGPEQLVERGGLLAQSVRPSGPSSLPGWFECRMEVPGSCSGDGHQQAWADAPRKKARGPLLRL